MSRQKPLRLIIVLLLSPVLLILGAAALVIGFSVIGGFDPAQAFINTLPQENPDLHLLGQYAIRCLFIPFKLLFVAIIVGVTIAIYQRRWQIATQLLKPLGGTETDSNASGLAAPLREDLEQLVKMRPSRHLTLIHIGASLVAVIAIAVAIVLALGQFFSWSDLAVIATALTSALAWGARLQVSDVLGGISNLIENNFSIGDQLGLRQTNMEVDGSVEWVDLRFTWLRASSGELISVPFGEIRTLRNFSRSTFAGVYVSFPVPSAELEKAITKLEDLAPLSPTLVPDLLEPWRVVSQTGDLGTTVELSLYGRAPVGREQELQLAMHAVAWEQLRALGLVGTAEQGV